METVAINNYVNYYLNILYSIFEYENLPEGMHSLRIERYLNSKNIAFFYDKNFGYLTLPATAGANLNIYGEPLDFHITGHNYHKILNFGEMVLMRNSPLSDNSVNYITMLAKYLQDIDYIMRLNTMQQKTPYLFRGEQKEMLNIMNMFKMLDSKTPAIFTSKKIDRDTFDVYRTDVPYLADKLAEQYTIIEGRILTYLGVKNIQINKKERLVVDEVNATDEHINCNLMLRLKTRQEAVEQINRMFNLNIKVKISDIFTAEKEKEGTTEEQTEGAEDV